MNPSGKNDELDAKSLWVGTLFAWVLFIVMSAFIAGPEEIRHGIRAIWWQKHDHPAEIMLDYEYRAFDFFLFSVVAMAVLLTLAAVVKIWWMRKDKPPVFAWLQFVIAKVGMMSVSGFVLVCVITATIVAFGDAIRTVRSLTWHEAEATIVNSSVTEVRDGKSWDDQLDLRYTYQFDGKRYEGSRWSLFDDKLRRKTLRKALGKLKQGDVVSCYVSPGNPAQPVLVRRVWRLLTFPLQLLVLLAIVALAADVFKSALREKPPDTLSTPSPRDETAAESSPGECRARQDTDAE